MPIVKPELREARKQIDKRVGHAGGGEIGQHGKDQGASKALNGSPLQCGLALVAE
jgi:hypothetical protein